MSARKAAQERLAEAFEQTPELRTYGPWTFSYEYPGIFTYSRGQTDTGFHACEVAFTPDYDERGSVAVQVMYPEDGTCVDGGGGTYQALAKLTPEALFALVKPALDAFQGEVS